MIFNSYAEGKETCFGIQLVSSGHIFAEAGRQICRPEGRGDWLLFYVAKESETFFFDEAVTAQAGSFVLFAPGERQHHIYKGNKTAEFYYVHFRCDTLPEAIALETSHVYPLPHEARFADVFEEIIEETMQKRPHYEMLCISHLFYLFSRIRRDAVQRDHAADPARRSVARAVQHMNRYCEADLRLEDYAAMCCMSKYHFLRVFKAVCGVTPMEYRSRIRIDHAKERLRNGYDSVCEIAQSLGYSSLPYFSAQFKRATGLSPTEYQSQRNGGETPSAREGVLV